jgi:hypothetical protein
MKRGKVPTQSWSGKFTVFVIESALTSHGFSKSNKKPSDDREFLCRPTAFSLDLLEPWDVRELYIRKTADLPMQLCLGTFPHFVAIGFYYTIIHHHPIIIWKKNLYLLWWFILL